MSNPQSLRVLIVEDSEDDVLLVLRALKKGGYNPLYERVETASAMKKALKEKQWDIILCDYKMPKFNAPSAISVLKEANIDIPLIVVTGAIGEETAVDCMRLGAQDYIMKSNMSRLCPAIARELEDAKVRNKQKQAESQREDALKSLRESEEKDRLIFEYSPLGLLSFDEKGVIVACNNNFVKIIGSSREKLIGLNMLKLPDKNMVSAVQKALNGSPGLYEDDYSSVTARKITSARCLFAPMDVRGGRILGGVGIIEDITERKQAEQVLRQSEEKYRTILENIQEGYFEVDLAGNCTFFNDSLCQTLGYSREELMGMNNRQYTDKENAKKLFQAFNEVYRTGEPTEGFDWQIIRKDGTKRFIEVSVSLQNNSSGQPIGFQGIARDITERKRAEEALHESEYKYKSLIENIPGIILTIDLEGTITFVSRRTNEILGYEDSEMINMAIFNFIPKEDHQRAMESLQKGMKGGKIKHFQIPMIAKSGEKVFFESSFTRIYKDGAVVGAQGTAVDITERKHAEEALRLSEENFRRSLEDLPLGVRIVTIEGETVYVNQAILDIYGYASMEELKTTPVENRYTPKSFAEYRIRREKRKRGDDASSEYDIDILRKDGEVRHLHVFRKDILWNGERQFQALYSDITDRKQAEERIHTSLREKEILLSEVHHRVKNNMQVISGLLALQARSTGNPELTGMLHESQSRIHAMSLVHEKLYGSKDFARIDLAGYVKTILQDLFQSYKINPGKIDLIIQTDGDVYVDINKAIPCSLILNELISNALKHAFLGDRHGELQIIIRETKNTEIEIVVRDNGLGLPDDVDIHQPRSVGLHLVNGLVKNQLYGQIEVRRDNGTEFRIKFSL
jgi:PAS domain S-box-containing protein